MSLSFEPRKRVALIIALLLTFTLALISTAAVAQSDPTPKWDLFVGYQFLHPNGSVPAPFGNPNAPTGFYVPDMNYGVGSSLTYNFDRHFGLEADFGQNWGNKNNETTASGGPRLMLRTDDVNIFVHGLLSYNHLSVNGLNGNNGIGAIAGGGMDIPVVPNKFLFRLFEADYVWTRHNFPNNASVDFSSLRYADFNGVRLRSGFVFAWGGAPELYPAVSCSVQPAAVMVGEPITATAGATNFNPRHPVTYSWSGNGGIVTGKDSTASIDTSNVAPGTYSVSVHVTDPKAKKNNEASCSASITVKPLPPKNPPIISCSANPSSVVAGAASTITCNASSPDGVPVTVSNWTSNAGSISGSGNTATLHTDGVGPGTVTVGATATDSRGLSTSASTEVTTQSPPASPRIEVLERRLSLHSIYFPTGQPPVTKPNAGLVPSQGKTLLVLATDFHEYLQAKPDAKLILEGHADARGSDAFNQALTERRVARVKGFLVENGIPEANIETRAYGKQRNLTTGEVRQSIENNPDLTPEERQRALRNLLVLRMASNRRVDITLQSGGETKTSVRQFPFNAADSLTLIGGRESEARKKAVPAKPAQKKGTKPPQATKPQ